MLTSDESRPSKAVALRHIITFQVSDAAAVAYAAPCAPPQCTAIGEATARTTRDAMNARDTWRSPPVIVRSGALAPKAALTTAPTHKMDSGGAESANSGPNTNDSRLEPPTKKGSANASTPPNIAPTAPRKKRCIARTSRCACNRDNVGIATTARIDTGV